MDETVFESLDHDLVAGLTGAAPRRWAARSRDRFSLGTYSSPKMPRPTPATQVQIHQRSAAGMSGRTASSTMSATAHPAVITAVTS